MSNKKMASTYEIAAIFIAAFVFYSIKQRKNDNPKIIYLENLPGNYNGFSLAPFAIFIRKDQEKNKDLLKHELIHWKQFQREGLISFLTNYTIEAINKGYDANGYEIEARRESGESEYCQLNYTECVRNGKAKTFNPNFRR